MELRRKIKAWLRCAGEFLFPQSLFLPGLPQPAPDKISIDVLPLSDRARAQVKQARKPLIAVLNHAMTLRRRVELPKAVGAKAEAAIGLQLRQTLPGQAQGLVWRASPLQDIGEKTEFGVYILKQSQLDMVLAELRALDARVDAVVIGVEGLKPIWERAPDLGVKARNWQGFTILAVALIGLTAVIGLESDRIALSDLVASRAIRVAELEERLSKQSESATKDQQSAAAVLNDMDLFAAQSRRLQLLSDLTAALPDAVWVSELSIAQDRIVLSGFTSGDVTDVIGIIQNLPWAEEVQLNGSILFDSYSGQNRFELGLRVADEVPV